MGEEVVDQAEAAVHKTQQRLPSGTFELAIVAAMEGGGGVGVVSVHIFTSLFPLYRVEEGSGEEGERGFLP